MSLGVRKMPEVELRAAPRGLRMGLNLRDAPSPERTDDPSAAVSFTYYEALKPQGKQRQAFYLDRAQRAHGATWAPGAAETEEQLCTAHLNAFPEVQRVQMPALQPMDPAPVRATQRAAALAGIRPWQGRDKRAAEEAAERATQRIIALELESRRADHDRLQAQHNAAWDRLVGNDPMVLLPTLEDAFADDQLPAVAVNLDGDELTLALVFAPEDEVVPKRRPNVTSTGRSTLKKRSKTEVNEFYTLVIASHVLAAVREALAFAPGLRTVRAVACRMDDDGLSCLYVGVFDRDDVAARGAHRQRSLGLFDDSVLASNNDNRTLELRPIDLDGDADLAALIDALDQGTRSAAPGAAR